MTTFRQIYTDHPRVDARSDTDTRADSVSVESPYGLHTLSGNILTDRNKAYFFGQIRPAKTNKVNFFAQIRPAKTNKVNFFAQIRPAKTNKVNFFAQIRPAKTNKVNFFAQIRPAKTNKVNFSTQNMLATTKKVYFSIQNALADRHEAIYAFGNSLQKAMHGLHTEYRPDAWEEEERLSPFRDTYARGDVHGKYPCGSTSTLWDECFYVGNE